MTYLNTRRELDWYALTWERLAWRYCPDEADRIMAGNDAATLVDLRAWRSLGRRSAA